MDKRRLFTNLKKEVAILASCAMILGVVPGTALMSNAESYKMRDKTTTTVDEKKDISQCEEISNKFKSTKRGKLPVK